MKESAATIFNTISDPDKDPARKGIVIMKLIENMQEAFNVISKTRVPVIACISGLCLGGAIDMISACDMVFSDSTAIFGIKEIAIGMVPDLGTLNRLTYNCPNTSLLAELVYTGRDFGSHTAKDIGLVSRVFTSNQEMMKYVADLVQSITSFSPTAVVAIKKTLMFHKGRD